MSGSFSAFTQPGSGDPRLLAEIVRRVVEVADPDRI